MNKSGQRRQEGASKQNTHAEKPKPIKMSMFFDRVKLVTPKQKTSSNLSDFINLGSTRRSLHEQKNSGIDLLAQQVIFREFLKSKRARGEWDPAQLPTSQIASQRESEPGNVTLSKLSFILNPNLQMHPIGPKLVKRKAVHPQTPPFSFFRPRQTSMHNVVSLIGSTNPTPKDIVDKRKSLYFGNTSRETRAQTLLGPTPLSEFQTEESKPPTEKSSPPKIPTTQIELRKDTSRIETRICKVVHDRGHEDIQGWMRFLYPI